MIDHLDNSVLRSILNQLEQAEGILLVTHIRPDGDAIGSLLGLGLALKEVNLDVQMVCPDGVPRNLNYLKGNHLIKKNPESSFDFVIVLDCSDLGRTGGVLNGNTKVDLNIDHHPTNIHYGMVNLVDSNAVATAEILYRLIIETGLPITENVASALLTGIVTDTLGFRTSNMNPDVLRISADLMEKGGDLPDLYQRSMINRSYEAARLWGIGLNHLQKNDRMVWTSISISDREKAKYLGRDDGDLINILSSINGADIAIIFNEQSAEKVKVSWRSHSGYDVSKVASQFGGGGHAAASGAEISGNLIQVKRAVLDATKKLFNNK